MGNIIGLDLGPNSIGWAVLRSEQNSESEKFLSAILDAGSRIIPMDGATLSDFNKGVSASGAQERRSYRSAHRMRARMILRRDRLHRVLNVLGFLPLHYESSIDFDHHLGQFISGEEPKIAWIKDENGKFNFAFMESFNDMIQDFATNNPEMVANGRKIPYDWTIYYLRKKALTQKISKGELSWILLNFNQKRGYFQLRGEEDENESEDKKKEFYSLKVIKVEQTDEKKGNDYWYNIILENGWIYRRPSSVFPNWEGTMKDFIVTTVLDKDGKPKLNKDGSVKRSFSSPKPDDWTLVKKKTEKDIKDSHKTSGAYIYDTILSNPTQKIRGKLISAIEREFYKVELISILNKQKEFHQELNNKDLYIQVIQNLYSKNINRQKILENRDIVYFLVNDLIFYQRPLKTKKSLIAECPYEYHNYTDKKTGEIKKSYVKCIAKSNPIFQEFRLWQFIRNIKIYQREKEVEGRMKVDEDVTSEFLSSHEDYARLFDYLNVQKSIDQDSLFKNYFKIKKGRGGTKLPYRWNYVEDKVYPCNETGALISKYLKNAKIETTLQEFGADFEYSLWHILYSVDSKEESKTALRTFQHKNDLPDSFREAFINFPTLKKEYGAYSEKAIRKFLCVMRQGHHWDAYAFEKSQLKERIDKIINTDIEFEDVNKRTRDNTSGLNVIDDFQGLPLWQASYVVYGRHSESSDVHHWSSPDDLQQYINNFKNNSLRNPIVEKVVLETLRVVLDLWKKYKSIDEIHIEMARELKSNADKRRNQTLQILNNENTNIRIKRLLQEFSNPEYGIEGVRPYSPMQQEILKIYEDFVLNDNIIPSEEEDILKKFRESDPKKQPTKNEVLRYKCWLEQKYKSPYTGEIIPLSKLFTTAYEIEHIIPKALYFDDSFSNKVICESAVNKLKDKRLASVFIRQEGTRKVETGFGNTVEIFSYKEYKQFVSDHYNNDKNRKKLKNLLADEVPASFMNKQLNDTRYIAKYIKDVLSNVVREEGEDAVTTKNILVCTGNVTDRLKDDWGLKQIWNRMMLPRFERLNEKKECSHFTAFNERYQATLPCMPLEFQRGYNIKRIDHRHHSMDAIVIACANRNIVNYLSNVSSTDDDKMLKRIDLRNILCDKQCTDDNGNSYRFIIRKPWNTFTMDVQKALESIVVSFKQKQRILTKATNYYQHYDSEGKKIMMKQTQGDHWAIRKPLHKETVSGVINIRLSGTLTLTNALENVNMIVDKQLKKKIKELRAFNYDDKLILKYFKDNSNNWKNTDFKNIPVYYFTEETGKKNDRLTANRKPVDSSFTEKFILKSIADKSIQNILLGHLKNNKNDPELAFSPDGIDEMNKNIVELNGGKQHKPIFKVNVSESLGLKYNVGDTEAKKKKYVEAAANTNLYFAVYISESGERSFASTPLNEAIELLKDNLPPVPEYDARGNKLYFYISPNDLVYVPTEEEIERGFVEAPYDQTRIYKMVSCTESECLFVPINIATPLLKTIELGSNNKSGRAWSGEMIKNICVPLKISRLGEIKDQSVKLR